MKNINISKRLMALLSAATIALTSSGCFEDENKKEDNKSSSSNITPSYSSKISEEELVSSSIAVSEIIESNVVSIESEISTSSKNTTSSVSSKNNSTSSNNSSKTSSSNKPITTSSNVSTSSKKEEISSDISDIKQLTKENINDPEIFLHLASNFSQDLSTATLMFYTYEYNGEKYTTTGKKEFALLMTMMNYRYMNDSTIQKVFKDCTLEELQRYANLIKDITFVEEYENAIFHFERYSIDQDIANLQYKYHDYLLNGNGTIRDLYKEYFKDANSPYSLGNTNNGLDYLFFYVANDKRFETHNIDIILEIEEKNEEMKQNYDDFVVEIYNKVNSKNKSLQLTK